MTTITLVLAIMGSGLQPVSQEFLPNDGWLSSAGGRYHYQLEFTKDGIGETPVKTFSLFDAERRPLLTLNQPGEENFMVSDAGWFTGIMSIPGRRHVTFYDPQGRIVTRRELTHDANYAFASTGQHFYVNTREGLLAYDARGRQTNRYAAGNWFRVNPDEKLIAVVRRDVVTLYRTGSAKPVQFRLGSPLFRDLAFSPDGQLMATVERSIVALYSLRTGERLWFDALPETTSFLNVAVSNGGAVYAAGDEAGSGFLAQFISGTEAARVAVPCEARNEGLTGITLDGGQVLLRTGDRLIRYEEVE